MKVYTLFLLVFILFVNCKPEKKAAVSSKEVESKSILEKVAEAHGYDSWGDVQEIAFTFNVDRDSTHFERSWVWQPKTNEYSTQGQLPIDRVDPTRRSRQ